MHTDSHYARRLAELLGGRPRLTTRQRYVRAAQLDAQMRASATRDKDTNMLILRLDAVPVLDSFATTVDRACAVAERLSVAVRFVYLDAVVTLEHGRADSDALVRDYHRRYRDPDRYGWSGAGHGYALSFVDGAA